MQQDFVKNLIKGKIGVIIFGGVAIAIFTLFVLSINEDVRSSAREGEREEDIIVAACPTFHYMLKKLEDVEGVRVVKTASTGETLKMIDEEIVDVGISGRPLKKGEPSLSYEIIGGGYDFVFSGEFAIREQDMSKFLFYTDIEKEKILEDFEHISNDNLTKVDDAKKYTKEGVVITFLNGRMESESVYILKNNGERVRLSRRPRVYYLPEGRIKERGSIKKVIMDSIRE